MSISLSNIRSRYNYTQGKDPLFAPVDGANCPDAVPRNLTLPSPLGGLLGLASPIGGLLGALLGILDPNHSSNPYSLLLNRGLIRVFMPWPPKGPTGANINPEFTLEVLSDPTKCQINPRYGLTSPTPMVSVYRRPLISSNLKFVTTVSPLFSAGLPLDPFTGQPMSGNIMWDGREPTLHSQAVSATLGHAQALNPPTAAQVQQMVDFENAVFNAQVYDKQARSLTAAGATGGPAILSGKPAGVLAVPDVFNEYTSWASLPGTAEYAAQRLSVARGQQIFNRRTFTIANVAGFNDLPFIGNNFVGTCGTCHNGVNSGSDVFADATRDLGTSGNSSAAIPTSDLPLFRLTCKSGATTPFAGTTVVTRDLGKALLTGKCADIGKIKVPQLRALVPRAPYFHDGSAAGLEAVVEFYVRRFNITFTVQEKKDLVNFMKTL